MLVALFAVLHHECSTCSRRSRALEYFSYVVVVEAPQFLEASGLGSVFLHIRMPGRTERSIAMS